MVDVVVLVLHMGAVVNMNRMPQKRARKSTVVMTRAVAKKTAVAKRTAVATTTTKSNPPPPPCQQMCQHENNKYNLRK